MGLVIRNGPSALKELNEMATRYEEGRAHSQQRKTFKEIQEALPKLLKLIEQKDIRVVQNAFNSTPAFVTTFETAAIAAIPLLLLDLAQSIKRVGASLDAIRSELAISNVSQVQGWSDGGFGGYVHLFVKSEMASANETAGDKKHFFYIWNPDSDWHPNFEKRQSEDPLGPTFGGYHHDLAAICLRMRTDRETLITTTDHGHTAVLHLVVPAYCPIVVDTLIAFTEELLPLTITGSRHRGTDLVWLGLDNEENTATKQPDLKFIGVLPSVENPLVKAAPLTFIGCGIGSTVSMIAMGTFPPCIPIVEPIFVACASTAMASTGFAIAADQYDRHKRERVQVLGNAALMG
ncbi:hypothetical protein FAVG1_06837 [Fusarium avenaceum]|nr:hypothetical protein FAVG1_06837 [Fusarium avenaceum]